MIKFNNGNGAVVCDICGKIISTGTDGNTIDICSDCQKESVVVDNFDAVQSIMEYDKENTFYWVQIIKRRKDNPGMHGDYAQFGSYCFYSYDDLLRKKEEIIKLCRMCNGRAVLWVNRRNMEELMLPLAQISLEYIQSKQPRALPGIFEHVCGKHHQKEITSTWIVDVDFKDADYLRKVLKLVKDSENPKSPLDIREILPTLHGYHILCTGFNIEKFQQLRVMEGLEKIDIQKDNPTVLYFCPK